MKAKKIIKKITALMLCATITTNTCTTALGESSTLIQENKKDGFEAVIQCETFDKQCGSSKIDGKVLETIDLASLNDGVMSLLDKDAEVLDTFCFGNSVITNNNKIYSPQEYSANAGIVNVNNTIVAEKNITFSASEVSGNNTVLYSKNENINFYCGSVDFTGVIYAPNGTVRFEGSNIDIKGVIIAKNVIVRAGQFNISYDYNSAILAENLDYVQTDKKVGISMYHNEENSAVVLQWDEESEINNAEIYARRDSSGFQQIASTEGNSYELKNEEIGVFADLYLVGKTKYGELVESNILTLVNNENGICEGEIDTDGDQIPDGYEFLLGTNANNADTDEDGFSDGYEASILCTDPLNFDENVDFDKDGLTNSEELKADTNPYQKDSDFDGIIDSKDINPTKLDEGTENAIDYAISAKKGVLDSVSRYVDESGNKCETIYNYLTGQIKYMTDSVNEKCNLYNKNSQLVAAIEKVNGEVFANTYSYNGENLETATHNGFSYHFQYDTEGNITKVQVGNKALVSNQYQEGALTQKIYGNGAKNDFSYDEIGNITEYKINGTSAYKWTYDEDGSMISYEDLVCRNNTFYTYDEMGNLESIETTEGFKIVYSDTEVGKNISYENNGIVKEQSTTSPVNIDENLTEVEELTVTTSLISGGTLISVGAEDEIVKASIYEDENEVIGTNYTYSENGISRIEYNNGKTLDYTFDKYGNIIAIQENGELKYSYEYDSLGQLLRENNVDADKTFKYTYDNAGNILSSKEYSYTTGEVGACLAEKKFDYKDTEWKDLLTNINGKEITYDAIGNPLSYRDEMDFSWTGRQLTDVENVDSRISYTYNSDGLRTSKTVNGRKTTYQLEETKIVSETTEGNVKWYIYDENDSIIGFESDEVYYFEKNSQGDVVKILNEKGECISQYIYDAWGNIITILGDKEIAEENPFRYRGYYYDTETGFYYLQSRYYDSYTGRFLNADDRLTDEEHILGLNLYTYCNNNCVNKVDYDGKEAATIFIVYFLVGALLIWVISVVLIKNVQKNWDKAYKSTMDYFSRSLDSLAGFTTAMANNLTWSARQVYKSVEASLAKTKTKPNYKKKNEWHHIVAKAASNATRAKNILIKCDIDYQKGEENLVYIKTGLHRRLHTNKYYGWANSVVISAYNAGGTSKTKQENNVRGALKTLKSLIRTMNNMSPY